MTRTQQRPSTVAFHVVQRITPFRNEYRVFTDRGGRPGSLVAFAAQKRLAFRESFTVFADEAETRPVLGISADRRLDLASVMQVTDLQTGADVGRLRKCFGASILRSTWELEQPGMPVVRVRERSLAIALLRRVWELLPVAGGFPAPTFYFDGHAAGVPVLAHTRRWTVRDHYYLRILSPRLDARLAIAMAICLDAMQHR